MIFQTSFRHELVHQESVVTIGAITNELDKILVVQLAKVVNLCLQEGNCSQYKQCILTNMRIWAKALVNVPAIPCGPGNLPGSAS